MYILITSQDRIWVSILFFLILLDLIQFYSDSFDCFISFYLFICINSFLKLCIYMLCRKKNDVLAVRSKKIGGLKIIRVRGLSSLSLGVKTALRTAIYRLIFIYTVEFPHCLKKGILFNTVWDVYIYLFSIYVY